MKIATLQLAAKLGDVEGNIRRANELLQHGKLLGSRGPGMGIDVLKPDILVLPELALTGEFNSCFFAYFLAPWRLTVDEVTISHHWRLSSRTWNRPERVRPPTGHETSPSATSARCAWGILKSKQDQEIQMA